MRKPIGPLTIKKKSLSFASKNSKRFSHFAIQMVEALKLVDLFLYRFVYTICTLFHGFFFADSTLLILIKRLYLDQN